LMADINSLKSITKKRLSKTFCGLSDVTIGKTYKQIKDLKSILMDDTKVNDICKEIARQKNKRIITEEVWVQMKRFNVDTSKYILEGHEDEYYDSIFDDKNKKSEINIYKKKNTESDLESDTGSENSYDDFEFMVTGIKDTLRELKYMEIPTDDAMDVINNIRDKLDILNLYVIQWAQEINILPSYSDYDQY
jgi:hypothetical protein